MRIIAWRVLAAYAAIHPETMTPLLRWRTVVQASRWASMDDVRRTVPGARILNSERVRFEVAGGNFRLIVAMKFDAQIVYVKFIGTHAEYDRIDALTISRF